MAPHDVVCLIGSSGSGKSTLLRCLNLLEDIDDGVIRFKAEASAWTPSAVQLQQVWTDPEARGRGDASRALRDLIRLLLERVPTVCLFVRPENAPALALYDRIGMERTHTYRSLLF